MSGQLRLAIAAFLMLGSSACTASEQDPAQAAAGQTGAVGGTGAGAAGAAGTGAGTGGASGMGAGTAAGDGASGTAAGAAGVAGTDTPVSGSGGSAGTMPMGGTDTIPSGMFDYENEAVSLAADLVIPAGETVRVGPGTTFTATAAAVKIQVDGTLIVTGTADAPASFLGGGIPRSWHGIVVASGGSLELTHAVIGGATYGIHALPGSDYAVDFSDISTSFKAMVVESDGTIDHTRFLASPDPGFSAVNEVSIDDVNGTLTILAASPTVTNSTFDGTNALIDMIRVGGEASPIFDHLHIQNAHCGIHANGGINSTPVITNTVFARLSYGMMIYATKPSIEDSVFMENGNDLGFCFGATADNVPTLSNNFYSSGAAIIDPTCFQIGTAEPTPATMANPAAGPVGL